MTAIDVVRLDEVVLEASPIDPAWIRDGAPVARQGQWTRSLDGSTTGWVWDCTAGTFDWYFAMEETVHIIEGEVEVSSVGTAPRTLRAGDAAVFRSGTWARWHVPRYVRKHAILRPHRPRPIRFLMRAYDFVSARPRIPVLSSSENLAGARSEPKNVG